MTHSDASIKMISKLLFLFAFYHSKYRLKSFLFYSAHYISKHGIFNDRNQHILHVHIKNSDLDNLECFRVLCQCLYLKWKYLLNNWRKTCSFPIEGVVHNFSYPFSAVFICSVCLQLQHLCKTEKHCFCQFILNSFSIERAYERHYSQAFALIIDVSQSKHCIKASISFTPGRHLQRSQFGPFCGQVIFILFEKLA